MSPLQLCLYSYTILLLGVTYILHQKAVRKRHREQIESLRSLSSRLEDLSKQFREANQHLREISPWNTMSRNRNS